MDRPTENPASKALQYCCVTMNMPLHSNVHVPIVAHLGGSHRDFDFECWLGNDSPKVRIPSPQPCGLWGVGGDEKGSQCLGV
jgi:hypothetical protein